jgi:hypothetical protein
MKEIRGGIPREHKLLDQKSREKLPELYSQEEKGWMLWLKLSSLPRIPIGPGMPVNLMVRTYSSA